MSTFQNNFMPDARCLTATSKKPLVSQNCGDPRVSDRFVLEVDWTDIHCPLCQANRTDVAYTRQHETGSVLGRIHKTDVVCLDCGFMYTNPRPSASDMRRYYSDASGASGAVFHSVEAGSRLPILTKERVAFMAPLIASLLGPEPHSILDIGCSSGDLLMALDLPRWHKAGLEPSTSASELAQSRGLDVTCGDLENYSSEDSSFAVISCISVIEHVWDLEASMNKIADTLDTNGLAFIEVPDSVRPVAQVAEFFCFEHLSHFTRNSLTRSLEQSGLEVVAFDENVSIPNLRVCAKRAQTPSTVPNRGPNDLPRLISAIQHYGEERRVFEDRLVAKLSRRVDEWLDHGARVAIYGAGAHTRFLMELFDLSSVVTCLLDSDPQKAGDSFLRWQVWGPADIPELNLDAILISSNAFESEIYAAILPVAEEFQIEVLRCYG